MAGQENSAPNRRHRGRNGMKVLPARPERLVALPDSFDHQLKKQMTVHARSARESVFAAGVTTLALVGLGYAFLNGTRIPDFTTQALVALAGMLLVFAGALALPRLLPRRLHGWLWPLALGAVTLAGLLLRVRGLAFGLPYVPHPDEPAVVDAAQRMLATGDLDPHGFIYPSFYIYLQALVYVAHLLWGFAQGTYRGVGDLPASTNFVTTAPGIYLWGRALTALLATGAILWVYGAGQRLYGRQVGLVAALLLAFAPATIADAHLITVDVPAAAFTALAFYWIVALYQAPLGSTRTFDWWPIARAGIGVGLATATKYNAVLIALPLALVPLLRGARAPWRVWLAGGLAAGLTFLAVTPYALLNLPTFLNDTASVITHYKFLGHPRFEGDHNWRYYAGYLWQTAPLPFALALGGFLVMAFRHRRADLLVLPFPLLYYGGLAGLKVNFTRNLLPLDPFLALAGAVGLLALVNGVWRLARRAWRLRTHARTRRACAALLALALLPATLVEPAWSAGRLDNLRAIPDSRAVAFGWMEAHLPRGAFWLVQLPPQAIFRDGNAVSVDDFGPVTRHPANWYPTHGFSYILLDSGEYDGYLSDPAAHPVEAAWYREALTRFVLVKTFPGDPGPDLALFDTRLSGFSMQVQRDARFGAGAGELALQGYNLGPLRQPGRGNGFYFPDTPSVQPGPFRPGEILGLTLLWQPLRQPAGDYQLFVHLRDASGRIVAQRDTRPRDANYPTNRWRPGESVLVNANLDLPGTLAPGRYTIVIGLYPPGQRRLAARPAPGAPPLPNDELPLVQIEVTK